MRLALGGHWQALEKTAAVDSCSDPLTAAHGVMWEHRVQTLGCKPSPPAATRGSFSHGTEVKATDYSASLSKWQGTGMEVCVAEQAWSSHTEEPLWALTLAYSPSVPYPLSHRLPA